MIPVFDSGGLEICFDIWPADCCGPLIVDQIIVDTRCIPEPGMLSLLVFAGLVLVRRRRWYSPL